MKHVMHDGFIIQHNSIELKSNILACHDMVQVLWL